MVTIRKISNGYVVTLPGSAPSPAMTGNGANEHFCADLAAVSALIATHFEGA